MADTAKTLSNEEFEEKFDAGEDILPHLDLSEAVVERNPPSERHVTLTMSEWAIRELGAEAESLTISRNTVANVIFANRLRTHA